MLACKHVTTEVTNIKEEVFIEPGNRIHKDKKCQLATRLCVNCRKSWTVIRYGKIDNDDVWGDWGEWREFKATDCKHHDSHLKILTDSAKYKTINTTSPLLWFAGLGWRSQETVHIANVECRKCGCIFTNCAQLVTEKVWKDQKIVNESKWVINRKQINIDQ